MKLRGCLLVLGMILPLLAQEADPNPPDAKRILGTWQIVKGLKDGVPPPKEMLDSRLIIDEKTITIRSERGLEDPARYTLDVTKKPAQINIMPMMGAPSVQGIYKFDKEELTIVFGKPGDERPKDFDSKMISLLVLRRAKEKK